MSSNFGHSNIVCIIVYSQLEFGLRGRTPRGVTGELSPASGVYVSLLPDISINNYSQFGFGDAAGSVELSPASVPGRRSVRRRARAR